MDTVNGGGGDDYISGGNDNDYLNGFKGDDLIDGDKGNDVLLGGGTPNDPFSLDVPTEFDTLLGGEGDDLLLMHGLNTASGEDGADTFALLREDGDAPATVTDYDPAEDSLMLFYDPADGAPDPADLTVTHDAATMTTTVSLFNGTSDEVIMTLENTAAGDVDPADFVFMSQADLPAMIDAHLHA